MFRDLIDDLFKTDENKETLLDRVIVEVDGADKIDNGSSVDVLIRLLSIVLPQQNTRANKSITSKRAIKENPKYTPKMPPIPPNNVVRVYFGY